MGSTIVLAQEDKKASCLVNIPWLTSNKKISMETLEDEEVYDDGNKVVITVRDCVGNELSKRTRDIKNNEPFKQPFGTNTFPWRMNKLTDLGYVYLIEGETDCLTMVELGYENVVSIPGVFGFKEEWAKMFVDFETIYIIFDNDEPGKRGALRLADFLCQHIMSNIRIVELPENVKDINELWVKHYYPNKVAFKSVLDRLLSEAEAYRYFIKNVVVEKSNVENIVPICKSSFNPKPICELLEEEEEPFDWIWKNYITRGSLILLAGSPKVGKSTFAYHLAVSIAKGIEFLNVTTVKTSVLILALEERKKDVIRRVRLLGANKDDIQINFGLFSIDHLDLVKEFVVSHNIGLVLVDTLGKIWNVDDENDAAKTEKAILPFLQLARETNAAVVLIHHLRKSPGSDGMDIRGSTALFASVDNAIILKRYGEGNERLIDTIGRWDCFSEVISLNGSGYEKLGSKSEIIQSSQKRKILDCLNDVPLSAKEVSELTGFSIAVSTTVLKRLNDDGEVERTGRGVSRHPFLYTKTS